MFRKDHAGSIRQMGAGTTIGPKRGDNDITRSRRSYPLHGSRGITVTRLLHPLAGALQVSIAAVLPALLQPVCTAAPPEELQRPRPEATSQPEVRQADVLTELALRRHPEMQDAASGITREDGLRFQSTRLPNPSIGYSASEVGNEGRAGQQGLFVSQQWITAGKLELADQVGAWRTRAAGERRLQTRLRLIRRVQTQYWLMATARRRVELLGELELLLVDVVRINQALREAAEAARGAELQARIEVGQVAVAKRQAEAELDAATAALAATLDVDVGFLASAPTDPWPEPLDPEWLNDEAPWQVSPELTEAQALLEARRWELRLAGRQIVSDVDSYASVQHDAVTDNVIVGLQVGVALPLRDRKGGLVQAARAEAGQAEAELARRSRSLQARWAQTLGEYLAAQEMVRAVTGDLLSLAEERLELARMAHAEGELEYLDLLTAQRSFLSVRQTELEARRQAALATVALQTLVVEDNR